MPRTLPAALTTVMDAGRYEAYLRVVVNSSPSDTGATTVQPLGFRLEALRATIKIAKFSNDITKYRFFRLVRGATINGTPSTISSVWFTSNDITFDGKFFNIKGELFDRSYQVADADSTYEEVIEFVSGQSSEILTWSYEGAAAWKNYKFYPTGRNVVVTPPMKLFTILRQKFLIFATEDGYDGANSSIFFFVATESRATDYTFTDVLFQGNEHTESRRLLSRDESNTIEINGTITHPLHNLGFIHSSDSQPTNTPNPYVGARSSKLPVHLKYRTGDHAVCLGDGTGLNELDSRINVIEVLDLESTPAWYQIIEALVWFGGTEGGSMPSTIEAAAPYTPLATGNFDGILTEEDNNLQAAMETIDDHEHAGSPESFALTGDISPSQITSNQNDYNPTGLSTATVLRLSTDASRNITGLQGGADGRLIFIHNVGSNNIVLKDADTNSSAANRFAFSADITMAADDGVILQYDSTSSRWRCIGKSPGGGSSGHTIEDEGTPLTARTGLNFIGRAVAVTDDSGNDETDVTISPDMELIETKTVGSDVASVTFSSIPATFTHLKIISSAKCTIAGSSDALVAQFNGDTGSVYDSIIAVFRHNATFATAEKIAGANGFMLYATGATANANDFATSECIISDYTSTARSKSWVTPVFVAAARSTTNIIIYYVGGQWRPASPAAISSIVLFPNNGSNIKAGSVISLYGIKG